MTFVSTCGFILPETSPNPLCGKCNTLFYAPKTIQRRPNIQRKYRRTIGLRRCRVIVDDIAHFFTCIRTSYDPIMSVKWGLGAMDKNLAARVEELDNAYLNREGRSQPARSQKRAFGDNSPGRPLNRASWTSAIFLRRVSKNNSCQRLRHSLVRPLLPL